MVACHSSCLPVTNQGHQLEFPYTPLALINEGLPKNKCVPGASPTVVETIATTYAS